jgi:hypothetical protein
MASAATPIIPLAVSVVVGEALLVFGTSDDIGSKCYNLAGALNFCLSPEIYRLALGASAFLFLASVALLLRRPTDA